MRVLIADDDKTLSLLLGELVRGAGHDVVPAYDAMQALMYAMRAPQPDLILLDLNMPGGTGKEALKKLKMSAKTAHIPIVVVSGTTDEATREEVVRLGAAGFLGKPVDPEALLEVLLSRGRPSGPGRVSGAGGVTPA
jgi:CheY-like chemotaxis protein